MTESIAVSKPPDGLAGPVTEAERFGSLDVLRGVAVLGILVMNIYAFAMPISAYGNPLVMGGLDSLNMGIWFFTHIFFDQKLMNIFSMLFGAGVVLMAGRAQAKGSSFGKIFYRRQFWLLVMGLVHAYLIWFGDILFFYALVGMVVYFFRNLAPLKLILIACILLPVAPLLMKSGETYMRDLQARAEAQEARDAAGETISNADRETIDEWAEARALILPGDAELEEDLQAHKSGYVEIVSYRAPIVLTLQLQAFPFFVSWRVLGHMLLGMALMKLGVLTGQQDAGFYRRLLIGGYIVGLPLTIYSAVNANAHEFDGLYMFGTGAVPNYIGSVFVALGHVGLVMLIVKSGVFVSLMRRLAAVGRMALTNYLMHSVVLSFVFYGHGIGLYGQIPRIGQMAFVAGLIGVQLILSAWWLSHYRFGPVEWLWRSLSYWQKQPLRRGEQA